MNLDNIPYEIHVTVNIEGRNVNDFQLICNTIGVKPIILDLEINDMTTLRDVMTSSKYTGLISGVYNECERICDLLKESDFEVLRKKIETFPQHPMSPNNNNGDIIDMYFETHIGTIIFPHQKSFLNEVVDQLNKTTLNGVCKLSQNFFKKSKDGERYVNMLIYRSNIDGSDTFIKEVKTIKDFLIKSNISFEKVEVEYCIYDSNKKHDYKWIGL